MPANTLRVVAIITAKPGKEDELRQLLESLIAPTHNEEGCIKYELHRNNANPAEFVFIEEWRSDADLDSHFETPHLTAALERVPDLLASELDVRRLTQIA